MISRVVRFFRGDDVFISYSRRDGVRYATGLARELTRRQLACRIDFWETVPGKEIPDSLRRAIRRSGLLAIVGSPGACTSPQVEMEIREFLPSRRNLVPIAVGEGIGCAKWFSMVEGLTVEVEPEADALESGNPTESVIKRIEDSCDFVRRNQRLRRTFLLTTIGTFLLVAGAGAWSIWNVARANEARSQAREAENLRSAADQRAQSATDAAKKQEQLASARRVASDLADRYAALGYTSVADIPTVIVNSRQLLSLDETVETSSSLSRMLALVPKLRARYRIRSSQQAIVSLDGRRIAAPIDKSTVVILQTPGLEEVSRVQTPGSPRTLAFTADSEVLAVSVDNRVLAFAIRTQAQIAAVESPEPVNRLSISRDGGYLAAITGEDIRVWRLRDGYMWTIPAEGEVDDLVFTSDGSCLAVRVFEQGNGDVLLLVDLATGRPNRVQLLAESGSLLALSPDGRLVSSTCRVGTAPDDCTTRMWALPDLEEYGQLPTRDYSEAMFSPDGAYIATSESGETRVWQTRRGLLLAVVPDSGTVAFSADGDIVAVAGRRGITAVSTVNGAVASVLQRDGMDSRARGGASWTLAGLTTGGNHAVVFNPKAGEIETWLMEGVDRAHGLAHRNEIAEGLIAAGSMLLVREAAEDAEFERSSYDTLWDIDTGERLLHVRAEELPASIPDGRVTVLASAEVERSSARRGSARRPRPSTQRVDSVISSSRGLLGLRRETAGTESVVTLSDLTFGGSLMRMRLQKAPPERFASPFGFTVSNGAVSVIDVKGGSTRRVSRTNSRLMSALCAPNTGCMAAFDESRTLRIRHLDRDETVLEIPVGQFATLSPDGTHVIVEIGGAIEVWEVHGKRLIARRTAPRALTYLGFDPEGRRAIIAGGRRVDLWMWRPEDLLAAGCERLLTNSVSNAWSTLVSATDVERACGSTHSVSGAR
jgi:WD40 repeat protein